MFKVKVIPSIVFCLFLLQQSYQTEDVAISSGTKQCHVENLAQPLNVGDTVPDTNGKCLEYVCLEGGYTIYGCPQYSDECIVEAGNPDALYPNCCANLPKDVQQPSGCTGVA